MNPDVISCTANWGLSSPFAEEPRQFSILHSLVDLSFIEQLVRQGGPRENDYPKLDAWIAHVHGLLQRGRISVTALASLRAAFGHAFSPATMQGFAFTKPHGYAGDYEIIDRIYQHYICPDPQLSAWDRYWQSHAAAQAVRNRKSYFHTLLDEHYARCRPLRVLKIASGPGRSMFEWLSAHPDARVTLECVENDPDAIRYASRLNNAFLDRITFVEKNALRYRATGQFDFIWAAGIFDYFDDRIFRHLLQRLLPALAMDGEMVVGNFSDQNPSRPYMEIFDWMLHHRSAEDLRQLARQCGISPDSISVGYEPAGVNLFLHIRRQSTAAT